MNGQYFVLVPLVMKDILLRKNFACFLITSSIKTNGQCLICNMKNVSYG